MVRRAVLTTIACLSFGLWLGAHTVYTTKVTWSRDVSRIMYRHCASCHHPGGAAFSLMTYQDVRPWAEAIKQQVLVRSMPPWNAVKGFGEFRNDAGLSQEDLEIIGEWGDGGEPEGIPAYLPPAPDFHTGPDQGHDGEQRITVLGTRVIGHPMEAVGIEPEVLPPAGVLQVIARRSDGSIEPLIWVEKFNPKYNQPYYFRETLHFPAGTKIEVIPKTAKVDLILKAFTSTRTRAH